MAFKISRLFHQCAWGLPRKLQDGSLEVECYECGRKQLLQVRLDGTPQSSKPKTLTKS